MTDPNEQKEDLLGHLPPELAAIVRAQVPPDSLEAVARNDLQLLTTNGLFA